MNKTAMQELIEYLKEHDEWCRRRGIQSGLYHAIEKATELLPTERQQIERAYLDGHENGVTQNKVLPPSDYFTTTYKTS